MQWQLICELITCEFIILRENITSTFLNDLLGFLVFYILFVYLLCFISLFICIFIL